MSSHAENVRAQLITGPRTPRQLIERLGISQPTLSRAITQLGNEVVRLGAAKSIQYALRDTIATGLKCPCTVSMPKVCCTAWAV